MSDKQDLILGVVEDNEIVAVPVEQNPTDRLIQLAIQGDADLDKLERLLDLKDREERKLAKATYDKKFARMQAQFTPVARNKKGYDYNYAPIEDLQKHYGPLISRYGFSYKWREEAIEGGKRCIMTISGHGHSEETYFDVPQIEGTSQMNPIQVAGAMSTYGRRYTFIAGFAIQIADEDDDAGLGFDDGVKYSQYILAIDQEEDHKALYEKVSGFVKTLREVEDNEGADIIKKYYTHRKKELRQ